MRKLREIILPFLILFSAFGFAQTVTVVADVKSILAGAQATKTKMCASLVDATGQAVSDAHVAGVGVIVPQQSCVSPDGTGHISTTFYANDQITAGGATSTTQYQISWLYNGAPVAGSNYIFLLADVSENLNTKAAANIVPLVTPAASDAVYMRLDAGNSPAGAWQFSALTDTGTLNVTGTSTLGAVAAGALSTTQLTNTGDTLLSTGKVLKWNADTGLSRGAANEVDCGNGTQGDRTCSLRLAKVNKITVTEPATGSTLTIADGKTVAVNKSLTLDGTDSTTMTFPTTNATVARTDAGQTFTGVQVVASPTINGTPTGTGIPTLTLKKGSGTPNYTSASATYVVMDATNLCYTVTIPTGWKLSVVATAEMNTATAAVTFFLALTDNGACSTANAGLLAETTAASTGISTDLSVTLTTIIAGDGASHNVALQFKTSNAADSVTAVNTSATRLPMMTFLLTPSN